MPRPNLVSLRRQCIRRRQLRLCKAHFVKDSDAWLLRTSRFSSPSPTPIRRSSCRSAGDSRNHGSHLPPHSFIRASIVAWVRSNCSGVTVMCRRQGRARRCPGAATGSEIRARSRLAARIDAAIAVLPGRRRCSAARADALDRPLFQAGNVDVEQRAGRVALPRDLLDDLARVPRPAGS